MLLCNRVEVKKTKECIQVGEKKYVMTDEPCETMDIKDVPKLDEQTKNSVKTELSTAVSLSIIYFSFIFAVPAINWFKPDWAFSKMFGGMSYSWFLTTIVAMAMAFIIAYLHTKLYERWEVKSLQANRNGVERDRLKESDEAHKEDIPSVHVSKSESKEEMVQ